MSSEAQKLHASFPSAGFTRRLAAWVYDLLVAAAIIMLASALALLFAALLTSFNWLVLSDDMDHAAWLAQGPWYSLYLITVVAIFFGWFWKRSGQTLGMRAWRLKLQNRDGSRLTNRQVFIRLLTCCGGLGNLWVLFDFKNRRAWQDYAAGTEVVTLSKEANQLFYWNEL
ncbi:MAG: RDD family protein [Pseudomonadota bacterium]